VIPVADLIAIAEARLSDVQVLIQNERFDGAAYLAGYVVELALKARICRTLRWAAFPETAAEFKNLTSFKTHKLDVLLQLSGEEQRIRTEYLSAWSAVASWDPETRYRAPNQRDASGVVVMFLAADILLEVLGA
jgi:HEPN domain-containing protein